MSGCNLMSLALTRAGSSPSDWVAPPWKLAVTLPSRLVMGEPGTKSPVISFKMPVTMPLASLSGTVFITWSSWTVMPSSARNAPSRGVLEPGFRKTQMRPRFSQYARRARSSASEKSYFGAMMKSALVSGGTISTSLSFSGATLIFWRSMKALSPSSVGSASKAVSSCPERQPILLAPSSEISMSAEVSASSPLNALSRGLSIWLKVGSYSAMLAALTNLLRPP